MMEYGFIIVVVVGGLLLRGAKAIIDAINKSRQNQQQSGPDAAMPTRRAPPTSKGRSSSPSVPVARPLPPRIRRSGQAPVARPIPGRLSGSGRVPAPPTRSPDELVIPQLVRELATPRQPGSTRQPKPKPRPRERSSSEKSKPRRTSEEKFGHLHPEEQLKHLDPESRLGIRKQAPASTSDLGGRSELLSVSSRAALRHAIVMREVLGPPLALRAQDEADPWGS